MATKRTRKKTHPRKMNTPRSISAARGGYGQVLRSMVSLLDEARRTSARVVNVVMTATYWEMGRRIVEHEQSGSARAGYGEELLAKLAIDLTDRFGRGFSKRNIELMRAFYLGWNIAQTVSAQLPSAPRKRIAQTVSAQLTRPLRTTDTMASLEALSHAFPLPWSHYVRLLTVSDAQARAFYELEALRGGWSVRQLDRQIGTQFYERTGWSRNKSAMLTKGGKPRKADSMTADDVMRDPFLLEFANLKDEYSESDLEQALVSHLESFLLELGSDYAFVGRQRRLRIGKSWFRVDLLFFHRRLRCLIVIDLKVGTFEHGDIGQMNLYLNYAREHWMNKGENPPVGIVLCTEKDDAVARYAMQGITNNVMAREYKLALPDTKKLEAEVERTRKAFERRAR